MIQREYYKDWFDDYLDVTILGSDMVEKFNSEFGIKVSAKSLHSLLKRDGRYLIRTKRSNNMRYITLELSGLPPRKRKLPLKDQKEFWVKAFLVSAAPSVIGKGQDANDALEVFENRFGL